MERFSRCLWGRMAMSLSVLVPVCSVCVCLSVCVCVLSHSACASVCSLHTLPVAPSQSCFVWQPSQVPGAAWHGADWPAHVHTCTRVRMSAHRHPRTSLCVPTSASIYQYVEGRASSWTSGIHSHWAGAFRGLSGPELASASLV